MRPASLMLCATISFLPVFFLPVSAETQVFQDAAFPYRISCKTEWTEEIKNDSMFQLKTTVTGKKTRFQLKKYTLAPSDSREIMGWSRVNFAVNREIASGLGTVISSDTGINKKVGDLRAFELCALYLQTIDRDSVWWGEISRWTEYHDNGYYVAIISDTADLIKNRAAYRALLDSVNITASTTVHIPQPGRNNRFVSPDVLSQGGVTLDLLGRKFIRTGLCGTQLLVQRHRKRLISLEPGSR
jgi:hypothetical protein